MILHKSLVALVTIVRSPITPDMDGTCRCTRWPGRLCRNSKLLLVYTRARKLCSPARRCHSCFRCISKTKLRASSSISPSSNSPKFSFSFFASMPVLLRHKPKASLKRHTWPQARAEQLETILESPDRTPNLAPSAESTTSDKPSRDMTNPHVVEIEQVVCNNVKTSSLDTIQTQMIWYSQYLAESQSERERLCQKIEELRTVCKSQSKSNAALLDDVRTWQSNYDAVEAELVEATQEIEEVKGYVRNVETVNANLRYALSQAKEEQERSHRARWSHRLGKCFGSCWRLPGTIMSRILPPKTKAPPRDVKSRATMRPESSVPILNASRSKISLVGT